MILILQVFLSLFLNEALAKSCTQHNPTSPDVPLCPAGGSKLLSENFPIMAATVSDDIGGSRYVKDYVTKILKAQSKNPPQFFLAVTNETWDDVVKELKKQAPDPETAKRWIAGLSRVKTDSPWNWQQDYFESFFDPKTGKPVLREVQGYLRHGDAFKDLAKKSNSECSIKTGNALTTKPYRSGNSGGNIEAVNGLCLLGADHFKGKEWEQYAKVTCENPAMAVKTPSDFLTVGHTDEFFKTLKDPSQEAPCDFSLAFASPKKGLELLKKNPQGRAFDFSNVPQEEVLSRMSQTPYISVCREYNSLKESTNNGTPRRGPTKPSRGVSQFYFDFMLPQALAGATVQPLKDAEARRMQDYLVKINEGGIHDPVLDSARRQERNERINVRRALMKRSGMVRVNTDAQKYSDCYNMTNQDLVNILEQDFEYKELNEAIEKATQKFKQDLLARIKKTHPQCNPKTVDLPDLFLGEMNYDSQEPTYVNGSADSIFPNPTNGEIVEDTFILPEPVNPAFKAEINSAIENLGLKTDYIDTHFAHSLNGNLHCSSHTMRFCRPRGDNK